MGQLIPSDEKLRRLNVAHTLLKGLLDNGFGYPDNVKEQLEEDLSDCEKKIQNHRFQEAKSPKVQVPPEEEHTSSLEIDKSYFETRYEIVFNSGASGQKGELVVNKKKIGLTGNENDICLKLFSELKKTWHACSPRDIGWVSFDDFRESVSLWKKDIEKDKKFADSIVTDETIRNAINRLNLKIRKVLETGREDDLIENGQLFSWKGNYRFRINTGHIDEPD